MSGPCRWVRCLLSDGGRGLIEGDRAHNGPRALPYDRRLRNKVAPLPARCIGCNYNLAGHSLPLRCPECGREYDEEFRVWFAQYTRWHLRVRGPYQTAAVSWVFIMSPISRLKSLDPLILTTLIIGLTVLVLVVAPIMRRRICRRGEIPFLAIDSSGLLICRGGSASTVEKMTWPQVAERMNTCPRPWKYGTDIVRDLGVLLKITDSRELIAVVKAKLANLQATDGRNSGAYGD